MFFSFIPSSLKLYSKALKSFFLFLELEQAKQPLSVHYVSLVFVFWVMLDVSMDQKIKNLADSRGGAYFLVNYVGLDLLSNASLLFPLFQVIGLLINALLLAFPPFFSWLSHSRKKLIGSDFLTKLVCLCFGFYPVLLDTIQIRLGLYIIAFRDYENTSKLIFCAFLCFSLVTSTCFLDFLIIKNKVEVKTSSFLSCASPKFLIGLFLLKFSMSINFMLHASGASALIWKIVNLVIMLILVFLGMTLPFLRNCSNKGHLALVIALLIVEVADLIEIIFSIENLHSLLGIYYVKMLVIFISIKLSFNYCDSFKATLLHSGFFGPERLRVLQLSFKLASASKVSRVDLENGVFRMNDLLKCELLSKVKRGNDNNPTSFSSSLVHVVIKDLMENRQNKTQIQEELMVCHSLVGFSQSFLRGFARLTELASHNPKIASSLSYSYVFQLFRKRCQELKFGEEGIRVNLVEHLGYEKRILKLKSRILSYLKVAENTANLLVDHKNLDKLFWHGVKLRQEDFEVMSSYQKINREFPHKKLHLLFISLFFEYMRGSSSTSRKTMKRFVALSQAQRVKSKFNAVFEESSRKTGIVLARRTGMRLIIRHVSSFFGSIFGFENQELLNQEIETIIPSSISNIHSFPETFFHFLCL